MMSAACAAALAGVYATAEAQGVLVPVTIEGPLSAYVAETSLSGELMVMNTKIKVAETTAFVSPTGERTTTANPNNPFRAMTVTQWMRGASMNGRRRPGLLGGTVIVTGEYDTATGTLTASEVFSDVAENVMLGAITDAACTTLNCDGPGDYIVGNGGTAFVPNKDPRITAGPLTDAGLFQIDATKASLVGTIDVPSTFGGEGYYSDDKILTVGGTAQQAVVYWAFELGENRPDLVATPGDAEISSLRIRCTEGGRIEVRGFVHAPMDELGNPTGIAGQPTSGGDGFIRVIMDFNQDDIITPDEIIDGEAPTEDLPATYGVYRVRADVNLCGTSADVYWMPNGGGPDYARVLDVPVDRLRVQ